jgi:3'-phosphoadenosine 5'-phosphosulfate sulfotransferase (PAPS reductase)/FAD synthetase
VTHFTESEHAAINEKLENATTEEILKWTNDTFGNTAAQMSSFRLEDQPLFHTYWSVNKNAHLMTLGTLCLSIEIYTLLDQTKLRYKVDVEFQYPGMEAVGKMVKENKMPYNGLHDKGYPSLGCAPCTRAIKPGEDIRAGR